MSLVDPNGPKLIRAANKTEIFLHLARKILLRIISIILIAVLLNNLLISVFSANFPISLIISLQQICGHFNLKLLGLIILFLELLLADFLHKTDFGLLFIAHVGDHDLDLVLKNVDFVLDVDLLDVGIALGITLSL